MVCQLDRLGLAAPLRLSPPGRPKPHLASASVFTSASTRCLHLQDGRNLMEDLRLGGTPAGEAPNTAEAFMAGMLTHLQALQLYVAGSPPSRLRSESHGDPIYRRGAGRLLSSYTCSWAVACVSEFAMCCQDHRCTRGRPEPRSRPRQYEIRADAGCGAPRARRCPCELCRGSAAARSATWSCARQTCTAACTWRSLRSCRPACWESQPALRCLHLSSKRQRPRCSLFLLPVLQPFVSAVRVPSMLLDAC